MILFVWRAANGIRYMNHEYENIFIIKIGDKKKGTEKHRWTINGLHSSFSKQIIERRFGALIWKKTLIKTIKKCSLNLHCKFNEIMVNFDTINLSF